LKEYLSLIPTRRADRRVLFWAYLSIPFQYYWVHTEWYGMFIIFIPVYAFLLIPTRMVMTGQTEGFLRSAGTVHWGLMTTVFSLSHAAYLLVLQSSATGRIAPTWPTPQSAASPGPGLLVLLVVLTQLNDVAQYVWGKSFGRLKVAPNVSPGKTVAGFAGDLSISALKRDLGVKDSGSMLPGHGGLLDRVDSLTYTAPLFFHYVYYCYF